MATSYRHDHSAPATFEDGYGVDLSRLCCPHCGGGDIHQAEARVYDRSEDAEKVDYTLVRPDQTSRTEEANGSNPSARRQGLRLSFWCETCTALTDLCIAQHKGSTLIHVEYTIMPFLPYRTIGFVETCASEVTRAVCDVGERLQQALLDADCPPKRIAAAAGHRVFGDRRLTPAQQFEMVDNIEKLAVDFGVIEPKTMARLFGNLLEK